MGLSLGMRATCIVLLPSESSNHRRLKRPPVQCKGPTTKRHMKAPELGTGRARGVASQAWAQAAGLWAV